MAMLSANSLRAEIERRLLSSNGAAGIWSGRCEGAYPMNISLGVTKEFLIALGGGLGAWSASIDRLAKKAGCVAQHERRKLTKSLDAVDVPVKLQIPGEEEAVRVAGTEVRAQRDLRNRRRRMLRRFQLDDEVLVRALRDTRGYSDADFSMLVSCAEWASRHEMAGLAPRQVPVPGVQGKFLDNKKNRELIATLAGKGTLGLSGEARYVMLKYLDPSSAISHGLCRLGSFDEGRPPYRPSFVVIVENKETFSDFPAMAGGVCVYGAGKAAESLVTRIGWLKDVPSVFYWGDMDSDGLEILTGIRAHGLACESVLMDFDTFERFEKLGTAVSARGGEIAVPSLDDRRDVLRWLTAEESVLYRAICAGKTRYPRIEQEKIPFGYAVGWIEDGLARRGVV